MSGKRSWEETPEEALERRAKYASEHPIPGFLDRAQVDAIRERAGSDNDGKSSMMADRHALLGHLDALERDGPGMPTAKRPTGAPDPWHGPPSRW